MGSNACAHTAVANTQRQLKVIKHNLCICSHWCYSAWSNTSQYKGMLDIPSELLLIILAYMDHHDLWVFALISRFFCHLLLPEYLHWHGLVLKDTSSEGKCVEVNGLSECISLGLWTIVPMFHPLEEMYFQFLMICRRPETQLDSSYISFSIPLTHLVFWVSTAAFYIQICSQLCLNSLKCKTYFVSCHSHSSTSQALAGQAIFPPLFLCGVEWYVVPTHLHLLWYHLNMPSPQVWCEPHWAFLNGLSSGA